MKKILFVGDYYPLFSYKSFFNYKLVEKLNKKGYEIILLSKSWCDADEETFYGSVESLSQNYPFYKRYFIDPLQVRSGNLNLFNAYLGLGCKIIEYEQIEGIIFADDVMFSPIIELFKIRYQIPCYLLLFEKEAFQKMTDDYVMPYIKSTLSSVDKIIVYPQYQDILPWMFGIDKDHILGVQPFRISDYLKNSASSIKDIYIYFEHKSHRTESEISIRLNEMLGNEKYFYHKIVSDINKYSSKEMSMGIIAIQDVPEYSIILNADDLNDNKNIDLNFIFSSLLKHYFPLITESQAEAYVKDEKIKGVKLESLFIVTYINLCDEVLENVIL